MFKFKNKIFFQKTFVSSNLTDYNFLILQHYDILWYSPGSPTCPLWNPIGLTLQWFLRSHQNPKVHYENIFSNSAGNGMLCISSENALHGDLKSALSLFVLFLVFEL